MDLAHHDEIEYDPAPRGIQPLDGILDRMGPRLARRKDAAVQPDDGGVADGALCGSKARHRLSSESVSWCLETSLFLRLPSWDRALSLSFLSFVFFPTSFRRQWAAFLGA